MLAGVVHEAVAPALAAVVDVPPATGVCRIGHVTGTEELSFATHVADEALVAWLRYRPLTKMMLLPSEISRPKITMHCLAPSI